MRNMSRRTNDYAKLTSPNGKRIYLISTLLKIACYRFSRSIYCFTKTHLTRSGTFIYRIFAAKLAVYQSLPTNQKDNSYSTATDDPQFISKSPVKSINQKC